MHVQRLVLPEYVTLLSLDTSKISLIIIKDSMSAFHQFILFIVVSCYRALSALLIKLYYNLRFG